MKISIKFKTGDTVWPIENRENHTHVLCKLCQGEKIVHIVEDSSRSIECIECYGRGVVLDRGKEAWYVDPSFVVHKIYAEKVGRKKSIHYSARSSGDHTYEEDLFATEAEAQEECDKRNSEEK